MQNRSKAQIVDGSNNLGITLRKLREERGLSERALADRSGLTRGDVNSIERGASNNPSAAKLAKLAVGLNVPIEVLLEAQGLPSRFIPREAGRVKETLHSLLERVSLEAGIPIPVYPEHPLRAREMGLEPKGYIYLKKDFIESKGELKEDNLEAYIATCSFGSEVKAGDVLVVSHGDELQDGDLIACLFENRLLIGRVTKSALDCKLVADEIEIGPEKCYAHGRIVQIRRAY